MKPQIKTEKLEIPVSDASKMTIYLAKPEVVTKAPVLFVLQEAFGVNAHIQDVGRRFANEGYVTIAPELFHRTAPVGFACPYDNFSIVMPHIQAVTPETIEMDMKACFEWALKNSFCDRDRVGAVGYCMGGRAAFIANSFLPLKGAVSYYGGGIAPSLLDLVPKQNGPLLLIWGGLDKHIGVEQPRAVADALRKANKEYIDVFFSQGDHGFFCDEKKTYNPQAAKESWDLTLAFLGQKLKGSL